MMMNGNNNSIPYSPLSRVSLAFLLALVFLPVAVQAAAPYVTFTYTPGGDLTQTQTAYESVAMYAKLGGVFLSSPSDIRLAPDGLLYVADTGNKRIVVVTTRGEFVRALGEGLLDTPRGVFVDEAGLIYVADENRESVLVLSPDGDLLREYKRPNHPLFGRYAPYKPQKVAVDKRGNVYITSKGNTNGVIQIAAGKDAGDGEFLGYFGANATRVTFQTVFRKLFYSQEQLNRLADVVPITVTNLTIDDAGLIYTVSSGAQDETAAPLKKLNVAGINILETNWPAQGLAAVTVARDGVIFAAAKGGFIYEYNSEGSLIFIFGARDDGQQRVGLFNSVSGIAVDADNRLYVLDEVKNAIQVFAPTEFASLVHTAFRLFNDGRYAESKEPWTDIVRMNSMFAFANVGLGEAEFREREYSAALAAFRRGNGLQGYSDTFWELRSDWLKNNTGFIIIALFACFVLYQTLRLLDRRYALLLPLRRRVDRLKNISLLSQCLFTFRTITNPADAAYGIKHEGKASWKSSFILLGLFYVLYILDHYCVGFLFKQVSDGYYDLAGDAFQVFGVFFLTVICCYLVCTITNGEAAFKELFAGVICAFAPVFMFKPLVIALTNVLTFNEGFFIVLINVVAYAWTAILVFLAIKYLNDYTFGETIRTVLLTAFVCLVCVSLLFIVYVLILQVVDFVAAIVGEAVFKIAKQ
jgi:outer membrane protein assembly factor BamB